MTGHCSRPRSFSQGRRLLAPSQNRTKGDISTLDAASPSGEASFCSSSGLNSSKSPIPLVLAGLCPSSTFTAKWSCCLAPNHVPSALGPCFALCRLGERVLRIGLQVLFSTTLSCCSCGLLPSTHSCKWGPVEEQKGKGAQRQAVQFLMRGLAKQC